MIIIIKHEIKMNEVIDDLIKYYINWELKLFLVLEIKKTKYQFILISNYISGEIDNDIDTY